MPIKSMVIPVVMPMVKAGRWDAHYEQRMRKSKGEHVFVNAMLLFEISKEQLSTGQSLRDI